MRAFAARMASKMTDAESAPVCWAITGILLRCPKPGAAQPPPRGKYPRRQHHRLALLLELTRQLADGGGFTDAVDADHQNHKRRFAFYVQRLIHFRQNIAHLFFQQAVQRLGVAQLLAAGVVGKTRDDLTRGFHADIGNQQLLFQLFKQIIVDFLTAEQTDKSGTEVLFGFTGLRLRRAKKPSLVGFPALTASRLFRPAPLQRRFLPHRPPPEPVLPALHR